MAKPNGVITRAELKFWIPLIGSIVAGALAFNTLKMTVNAMNDKYESAIVEMKEDIKIIKDSQIKIMVELGIVP